MSFVERHPTGVTIAVFAALAIGLSLAPVPEWARPLDFLQEENVGDAMIARILARPESMPKAAAGYGEHGAAELPDEGLAAAETPEHTDELMPSADRPTWKKPERKHFDTYAASLGLKAAPVELPCAEGDAKDCRRHALDRFFEKLAAAEAQKPGAVARIVHYGDSLIASDKITDLVRVRLQERFGSAGKGFLLVKRFNTFQKGHRTGEGTPGWALEVITQSEAELKDRYFGYSGASFTAEKAGEESVFTGLGTNTRAEVHYLAQPSGGGLELLLDGKSLGTFETKGEAAEAQHHTVTLPPGGEKLVLRATSPGARVFGLVLEADLPGVVYESVGLPGATSEVWLRPEADDFQRQLGVRDPSLIVVMLGGNDGLMLSKGRTTLEAIEKANRELIARLKVAAPHADCLLVSPLEAVRAKADGRMVPKQEVKEIIAMQKRLSTETGCAFWDMYASMGGEGSLKKWIGAGLMLADLIHPKSKGSDLLGEMMAEALMNAYDQRQQASGKEGL